MKRTLLCALVLVLTFFLPTAPAEAADLSSTRLVPLDAPDTKALREGRLLTVTEYEGDRPVITTRVARSKTTAQQILSRSNTKAIKPRVSLTGVVTTAASSLNDPLVASQWPLRSLQIERAWQYSRGAGQVIAVVDTGVAASHPDLQGQILSGIDLVNPSNSTMTDPDGHGTHIAGIVGAVPNNGIGVAGVAPDARILPVRVLDENGEGTTAQLAQGMVWAVEQGATVLNLSLGTRVDDAGIRAATTFAQSRGLVVVAASGNDGDRSNQVNYPCAYQSVLCVAATDSVNNHASYSTYGPQVRIAAPGSSVVSTYPTDSYATMSGTSMATPHVAGTAALVRAAYPNLPGLSVVAALETSAWDLGSPGLDQVFGHGLLQPVAALETAQTSTFLKPTWMVAGDGGIFSFGNAGFYGSTGSLKLNRPVVGMAASPTGRGYWLVASDGGIFAFGDAGFYGSMGGTRLNQPVVGMAASPTGRGYWLVASDGGIFAFGDAGFYGSTGSLKLNRPVVGMTTTESGKGYWFVASDGGIFAYGDAAFFGSAGSDRLNAPIVGLSATPSGKGYWLVANDGGLRSYGDAPFQGNMLGSATVGMSSDGQGGYLMAAENGALHWFRRGAAPLFLSSGFPLNAPMVGVATPR